MPKKKPKPAPQKPAVPCPLSAELQTCMNHFVKATGHILLLKVNPEAAREMASSGPE